MRSLRKRCNKLWLGLLAALSLAPGAGAHAAPTPGASAVPLIERVAEIRARLLARDAQASAPSATAQSPDQVAQLNRRSWPNWSNWNNWLKWSKY